MTSVDLYRAVLLRYLTRHHASVEDIHYSFSQAEFLYVDSALVDLLESKEIEQVNGILRRVA